MIVLNQDDILNTLLLETFLITINYGISQGFSPEKLSTLFSILLQTHKRNTRMTSCVSVHCTESCFFDIDAQANALMEDLVSHRYCRHIYVYYAVVYIDHHLQFRFSRLPRYRAWQTIFVIRTLKTCMMVMHSYLRNYKLYKHVFCPSQRLSISPSNKVPCVPPDLPPLREASTEAEYIKVNIDTNAIFCMIAIMHSEQLRQSSMLWLPMK